MDRPSPRGFSTYLANVGLRDGGGDDFAVLLSDVPAVSSAVFTKSRFAGPSVALSRAAAATGVARGVLVVAKNANVATGDEGKANAEELRRIVAGAAGVREQGRLVASTGVIGRQYPMDQLRARLAELARPFPPADFDGAARAIMTTDTRPKVARLRCGDATIVGIAKGVGMIEPN